MRVSTTQIESYRLFMQPDQEWMPEADLLATIRGEFTGNHKTQLGSAFGKILEDPDRYVVRGGFECGGFGFGSDVIEPCLSVIDRRGIFEAKAVKSYDGVDVVACADHLLGAHLSEFKTTLSGFDPMKYMDSCQWKFMADIFHPLKITYHVFCLYESAGNGVIELKSIETLNLYPYSGMHAECAALVREFVGYVTARGLDAVLKARQEAAA